MNGLTEKTTIDGLGAHPLLLHGTSLRYCGDGNGGRAPFLAGKHDPAESEQRSNFVRALGGGASDVLLARQMHTDRVLVADGHCVPREFAQTVADAIVTNTERLPVGVLTADCIPVILYDPENHAVGVVHAGRRGTEQNILAKTVDVMQREYATRPERLSVGMGPGICGSCYEVDEPCLPPLRKNYPADWSKFVAPRDNGRYLLDLFAANASDARSAGVHPERIFRSGWCTSCRNDMFYSYRREGGTGRLLTVAVLRGGREK